MTDNKSSLLAAGVQAELIPIEELPDGLFEQQENPGMGVGRYTAERFFLRRPDDYKLCVSMLAGGMGLLYIARCLRIHHMTVAAVRDREGEAIDISKERIRKHLRLAIGIGAERLPEILERLPDRDVPLSLAILIDKLALLDGEPTQRIETTHHVHLTHEAVRARLSAFPDAVEIEAEKSTGFVAGRDGQKGLPTPGAPGFPEPVNPPSSDNQSGERNT